MSVSVEDSPCLDKKIITCPKDLVLPYRQYMMERDIPFKQMKIGNSWFFLVDRKLRPNTWKVTAPK